MHIRTTINIDDRILEKASELTGIRGKTSLIRKGLETLLITLESSKPLAELGGTEKDTKPVPRRRMASQKS